MSRDRAQYLEAVRHKTKIGLQQAQERNTR